MWQAGKAQPILQTLIQANPHDLTVWSWYVKSCQSAQERYQALQACLKANPGNNRVIDPIMKLEAGQKGFEVQAAPASTSDSRKLKDSAANAGTDTPSKAQSDALLVPDQPPAVHFTWYVLRLAAVALRAAHGLEGLRVWIIIIVLSAGIFIFLEMYNSFNLIALGIVHLGS